MGFTHHREEQSLAHSDPLKGLMVTWMIFLVALATASVM
jgi:hypothetical protein